MRALAPDHFSLLADRGVFDPPLLSDKQNTHRDTRDEVLGWIVDTEWLTVTLLSRTRLKLYPLLLEWPPSRAYISATEVAARCLPRPYLIRFPCRGFPSCHVFWSRLGWRALQPPPITLVGGRKPAASSSSSPGSGVLVLGR